MGQRRTVDLTRHYSEHRARQQFSRKLEQLDFELSVESPRRVLDYLIDHLDDLLPRVGDSLLRDSFASQLTLAKARVSTRHNLRLVKGA
jgi:hypothetical protein